MNVAVESAVQAKRDLGDPHSLTNGKTMPTAGALQLGGGQQISSLRFGWSLALHDITGYITGHTSGGNHE